MMTLTAVDSFEITQQVTHVKTCWVVKGIAGLNPKELLGTDIMLNGKPVHVVGVETFAITDPVGFDFSLVVEPR